jgi:hypothetical protein
LEIYYQCSHYSEPERREGRKVGRKGGKKRGRKGGREKRESERRKKQIFFLAQCEQMQ